MQSVPRARRLGIGTLRASFQKEYLPLLDGAVCEKEPMSVRFVGGAGGYRITEDGSDTLEHLNSKNQRQSIEAASLRTSDRASFERFFL